MRSLASCEVVHTQRGIRAQLPWLFLFGRYAGDFSGASGEIRVDVVAQVIRIGAAVAIEVRVRARSRARLGEIAVDVVAEVVGIQSAIGVEVRDTARGWSLPHHDEVAEE